MLADHLICCLWCKEKLEKDCTSELNEFSQFPSCEANFHSRCKGVMCWTSDMRRWWQWHRSRARRSLLQRSSHREASSIKVDDTGAWHLESIIKLKVNLPHLCLWHLLTSRWGPLLGFKYTNLQIYRCLYRAVEQFMAWVLHGSVYRSAASCVELINRSNVPTERVSHDLGFYELVDASIVFPSYSCAAM